MQSDVASSQRLNSEELRSESLKGIILFNALVSYVWLFYLIGATDLDIPTEAWLGAAVLCLASFGSYALFEKHPGHASALLVMGGVGAAASVMIIGRSPHTSYLFLIVIAFSSMLLGQAALFLTALASISLIVTIAATRLGWPLLSADVGFPILVISLVTIASWLSARRLNTALDWVVAAYGDALRNERLANERRGDLRRVLNALDEANSRLERANGELIFARLKAEETQAIKEQFVANVSHELRTPLNLMVGFAEMMYLSPESYEGVGWTPDLRSDIGEMYRASRHLQSLVDDILDLSRIDAGRLPMYRELMDIRPVIEEALETIAPLLRQHNLSYDVAWPESLPRLFVDPTRIRQIMLNLLNNAARFTDAGGITVHVQEGDDSVLVSVEDTGIGIPQDQLETIFEEFRQVDGSLRRRAGAGLGLALSRQFVELHGGRIHAESQLGHGSVFRFSLPLPGAVPQAQGLVRTPDLREADLSKAPIMVIDPDPGLAQMLSRYLDDRRVLPVSEIAEVDAVVEAEHPLAIIVNQPPSAPPQTWVGDVGHLSERYQVPVYRCSIPSASWLQRSAGVNDCLTKPVSRESLARVVSKYCREKSTVLIVDDSPGFVSYVSRLLRIGKLAGEILTAYNGADALRLARERAPALLLLDLLMPEMDGFAVLSALREEPTLPNMAIVVVTATSFAEESLYNKGGYFTITQPGGFTAGALTELLRASLQYVWPAYAGSSTSRKV